jgi:HEAT repeat protein
MVQDLAMVLIGSTRSLRAAKLLLELKGTEVDELPYSIALSLLGPLPYELTLRQALETKGEIPRASAVLAYSFVPLESSWAHLFDILDSDSMGLARAHAAFGLSNHKARPISNTQAKILIEAAEKGPDIWVRGYSALALGRYSQNKDVAAALESMMDNPNINIKAMAAFGAGINRYPKGVQILKELIEKEKSYAVFAQIISLGMFQHRMFVPYFGDGIKFSSSDHERLAFAAALSSSLEPGDYPEILEKLANANSVDRKTYAWTLALHDYPGLFLARKVVDALKQAKPDNDDVTRFHLALARCSLGDGVAAKELIEASASKGFSYHQILPEPRFLLEYFQSELPDYGHILPYFHLD